MSSGFSGGISKDSHNNSLTKEGEKIKQNAPKNDVDEIDIGG